MPDLKSELKKLEALKFDDEGTTQQEITMNDPTKSEGVSEKLFRVIKENPGCTRSRILAKALTAGIGMSSSSSLLAQFVKRGLVRIAESPEGITYFNVAPQYIKGYIKTEKKAKPVKEQKVQVVVPKQDTSVQELLNTMSIVKARALYDELKKIFGG
jgi:hypothetical protein